MTSVKRQKNSQTLSVIIGVTASIGILPQTAEAQFIQRSFLNPSFEQNLTDSVPLSSSPGSIVISAATQASGSGCFVQVDQTSVPAWNTTHSDFRNGGGNCSGFTPAQTPGPRNLIELWTSGFNNVVSPDGNVFAELNAEENSKLFQNLCLLDGETITFSVNHRGRSSATVADVASFVVDNQRVVEFGTASDANPRSITPLSPPNATILSTNLSTLPGGGWVEYSGSLEYTGADSTVRVGFEAISTAGGSISIGNFIDNTQFAGLPVIEVAAQTGNAPESETTPTTNPPQIRVVGLVGSSGLDVTITVESSSTAILGSDFQFQGGTVNGNTVTITIPPGNYDGTAATGSLINIPIEIIQDQESEGNETIEFVINADPTKFFNLSTTTCGAAPITSSIYTIFDDEFLSGTVWNDVDNSANNTFTNIQTGSEVGTNADSLLNAILVDSNGNVLASAPVQPDGTYTFDDVPFNTNVRIRLSTSPGIVGNPAPVASLPSGWEATSPLETDPFDSSNNIQNRDFGIRRIFLDYGDAPDTSAGTGIADYQTIDANNGPRHVISTTPNLYLGTTPPDSETDGQPTVAADGDDINGAPDDEDAITAFPPLTAGMTTYTIPAANIVATNTTGSSQTIHGWIDFDKNGVFEADEYASTTINSGASNPTLALTWSGAGLTGITPGDTYARFRITSDTLTAATGSVGLASDGEVEDYQISQIRNPDLTSNFCGPNANILFILDESTSVDNTELEQQRAGIRTVLQFLVDNNVTGQAAIVSFGTNGIVRLNYTALTQANVDGPFNDALDDYGDLSGTQFTNWEAAFQTALSLESQPPITPETVFFFTDGLPNRAGIPAVDLGATNNIAAAVDEADVFKAAGIHIYAIAIGSEVNDVNDFDEIAGPDIYDSNLGNAFEADYVPITSYGDLADELETFFEEVCVPRTDPNVLLVKRITAVNNINFINLIDASGDEDNNPNWPNDYLKGKTGTVAVSGDTVDAAPGDEVEYTIYFLNAGNAPASSVQICDALQDYLLYEPDTYDINRGIELSFNSITTAFTNSVDGDSGEFVAALAASGCQIEDTGNPGTFIPLPNPNGTLRVELDSIAPADGPGDPDDSFGFIRFRARVK
ncbi:hypothetical protein AWQ21_11015 [Picosynechococcus sp. PCC 7003]|uniref:GEVED domain-containing protein n=1 Tax=Picosynechococcus sp. PCC 7003 TaxID=374981 RepID=UPI000810D997|nr:GEVED domain-containing protein [Picosynechococcus sp. PCC 7003]ANV84862.1 hypothetical protein AWQ21_11015 [Picosynechococcus sp. PCC 7003]